MPTKRHEGGKPPPPRMSKPVTSTALQEEDSDEENDRRLTAYLQQQRNRAISEFRKCIASMQRHRVTEVIANDHPSYDLKLYVASHNGPKNVEIHSPHCGDGSFHGFATSELTEPFFCDCWLEAGGPTSDCRFIVFANGIGDMTDLSTRKPPPKGSIKIAGW